MERHHHPNDCNLFAKTVCTICFEGLNPIIEDLQTISICGHVFHELCLQQRLESCPSGKKKNACPVCKQKFSQKNVNRLYFQLIGEPISSPETSPPSDAYQDSVLVLRGELGKLGEKLASVSRAHEQQQQHLRELMKELSIANDRAVKEEATKVEVLRENAALQQTLKKKTEDLAQSNAERSKLQEKILALEKDLAAHKLVSNLDLDEAEITGLVGHAKDSENVIDTLRKSLILRSWSYKELMAQCDLLGREEQSSQKKLAKAVKKMKKLKERLKKLERAVEDKDNEILRNLKEPKRVRVEEADEYGVKLRFNNLNNCKTTVKKESVDVSPDSCCTHFLANHSSANANGDLSKEQKASNLKILKREIIDVDMEEAEIPVRKRRERRERL